MGGTGVEQGWRRGGIGMVQGWCSGESTRLPPMWPRFDSSILGPGVICRLSLLLVISLLRVFFLKYSGILLSRKTNTAKFQFDPECTDTS